MLVVDKGQNEILIQTREMDFGYKFEDIETAELNLGIYYKNQLDNRGRWPAPWTNYGYLKVKFKDGEEFFFTSIMLELDKLPFPETSTKFRLLPYIKKSN